MYTALGDSYSSGEGVQPFCPRTDTAADACHRSLFVYSQLLSRQAELHSYFWACSGATTPDVLTRTYQTEPPEIRERGVGRQTDLLTITIGGNDAGFAPIARACILAHLRRQTECVNDQRFRASTETQIRGVQPALVRTFSALRSAVGPSTSMIVLDYPHILPSDRQLQACREISSYLAPEVVDWFNSLTDTLDEQEQAAARIAGVNFTDISWCCCPRAS